MKSYGLLFLLLLGISSTASGYCWININVDEIVCGEAVTGSTRICCSGTCTYSHVVKTYCDNTLYADVYVDCQCTSGSSLVTTQGTIFGEATCGWHHVVVRVWCDYGDCGCFPYCLYPQPVYCGMARKSFRICCDGCGCGPCRCPLVRPCCPQQCP